MTLQEVIDKYFNDGKTKYFHSSDAHRNIEGDTYLTYRQYGDSRIELYMGGDSGEICLCVSSNPEKIESLIKTIIYP